MMKARAIANNDMAYLQWSYDSKIPDCLGFSVHRVDLDNHTETPLPTWVGFQAVPNIHREMRSSDVWPIQKFQWKDVTARRCRRFRYRVIPMIGQPTALTPDPSRVQETNEVSLQPRRGDISVYFNRGIISTQAVAKLLHRGPDGKPDAQELRNLIKQPTSEVRERLVGDLDEALLALIERANSQGGHCYCALYELSDEKLLRALLDCPRVHLVLSNTGEDDGVDKDARRDLHNANKDIIDRMLGNGHIGHNKFVVYTDPDGVPQGVLTGSTNWTPTGLCSQTNNALILESETLARQYMAYWQALRADNAQQGQEFRAANRAGVAPVTLGPGQGSVRLWCSPNTAQTDKPAKNPATPADLQEVFDLLWGAKKGVLFLVFQPGRPSIVTELKQVYSTRLKEGRRLFIRGAATDQSPAQEFKIDLFHRTARPDASVVSVAGIDDDFSYWQRELYILGHAVIHDKIVVVDPFTDDCAVVTGSHNLGFKASYANDENLLIIRGHRAVAEAYAAHVLDIYDHFRWRYQLQQAKLGGHPTTAWQDLDETDGWQDKYYDGRTLANADMAFWE
jgi:phosphatidylserine/phosphatidylglycerophosphate/cardiolipin synthase-like enzyme